MAEAEEHLPRLVIPLVDGNVVVVPALYFENIINGDQDILPHDNNEWYDNTEMLLRTIVTEWYSNLKNK